MTVVVWLLAAYVVVGGLYWLLNALVAVRTIRAVPRLEDVRPPDPAVWPRVSLIIAACDEGDTIEAAMASRLREDYPDLEFILVDDRSTDDTGRIIDRVAASDPRVKPLHIRSLPDGWLGKVHAMHQAVQVATGDWLLFTDADVHFAPGTIRRTIANCLHRNLDHLAAFPAMQSSTFWLDVVMAGFLRLFFLGIRAWAVEDPASKACIGIGAFNLVRRTAFDRTEGFPWLKLELGDDVALGMLLKSHGCRSSFVNARKHVSVRWYSSVRQMARGAERGGYTVLARFSLFRAISLGMAMLALELAPFLAMFALGMPVVQIAGAIAAVVALATTVAVSLWMDRPILPALLLPAASAILSGFVLRAGYLGYHRGGILWRGTLYKSEVLRAGARVQFPSRPDLPKLETVFAAAAARG